jgi:hypothetical protein
MVERLGEHMQRRKAEKEADLESLADAVSAFRLLRHELDQWERVHLARGLAAVFLGCYGGGAEEAARATMREARVRNYRLIRFIGILIWPSSNVRWTEPARRPPFRSHQGAMNLHPGELIIGWCNRAQTNFSATILSLWFSPPLTGQFTLGDDFSPAAIRLTGISATGKHGSN